MKEILVIGAGAAGIMAALAAAEAGAKGILIEKNDIVGKKMGITGKGPLQSDQFMQHGRFHRPYAGPRQIPLQCV